MGAAEDASAANAAAMAKLKMNSDGSYDWVGAQSSIPGAAPPTARTPNADALDASARASFTPPQVSQSAPSPTPAYGGATGNYGYPSPATAAPAQPPLAAGTQRPSDALMHSPPQAQPSASAPPVSAPAAPAPAAPQNPITAALASAANPWVNGINTMDRAAGQGTGGIGSGSFADPYNSYRFDPNDPTDISILTAHGMVPGGTPVARPVAGGDYVWAGGQAFYPGGPGALGTGNAYRNS